MKRFNIVFLSVILLSLITCSKDKDNDEPELSTNADTIMIDILTEVSPENETFMDIAPIPISSELYDYAELDTNFQTAINAMESFNDMIENPGILLGSSLKSAQTVAWESLGCEDYGNYSRVCKWEQDHGEYKYTTVQTNDFITGSILRETFIRGVYDGFDYDEWGDYEGDDEGYRISDWLIIGYNTTTVINIYFTPFNDIVADEPVFTFIYTVGEGYTIYTPWGGTELVFDVVYQDYIYSWSSIDGHYPSIYVYSEWEGDLLSTIINTWCLSDLGLRPTYTSTYNFETHEGAWCTYMCNGEIINCHSIK